jgi:hypothetical protein
LPQRVEFYDVRQNDLTRPAVALPRPVGVLEEDLVTFDSEAQLGEWTLVSLLAEVRNNASNVLQREALAKLSGDEEGEEIIEGV